MLRSILLAGFLAVLNLHAATYLVREPLTDLPATASVTPEGAATVGFGRLEKQQAVHLRAGSLTWPIGAADGDVFVEAWICPDGWDADTPEEVVLATLSFGSQTAVLRKAAGAPTLELAVGGRAIQSYPIHDWKELPWMNGTVHGKIKWKVQQHHDQWHYVHISYSGGRLALAVDGFAATEVAPATMTGPLTALAIEGGPGTAWSWLHVVAQPTLSPEALRARYRSLYRGLPDLHPNTVTIPRLARPPALDGTLSAAEWDRTATLVGFSRLRAEGAKRLTAEPIQAQMGYDERYVYLAFRTPYTGQLRAREYRAWDRPLWGEESYEMFFHPPYTGVPDFCQLVGNPYGDQADLKMLNVDWNGKWDWKASILPDTWLAEMRVDFAGTSLAPPGDLAVWTGNLVNTYANAGWSWTQRYNDTGSFGVWRFDATGPIVRPAGIELLDGRLRVPMVILGNGRAARLAASLQIYGPGDVLPAAEATQAVDLAAGGQASFTLELSVDALPAGTLALFVREGETDYFYHSVGYPAVEPTVRTPFPAGAHEDVEEAVAPVAPKTPETDEEKAAAAMWSAEEIGQFLLDSATWRGGRLGESVDVPKPWTPMTVDGQTVTCWGRRYTYRDSLFPVSIVSDGEELLAQPVGLLAGHAGNRLLFAQATVTIEQMNAGQIRVRAIADDGPFRVQTTADYEFDGMARIELEIGCPNDTATLDSLGLSIPLLPDRAQLYHLSSSQSGHAPFSTSEALGAGGLTLDAFREVVWVGDQRRGLCWFAESLARWPLAGEQAIQTVGPVVDGQRLMHIKLGDKPVRLEQPLRLVFGLQATPMKPRPAAFRTLSDRRSFHWQWFWGAGQYYPFQDDHIAAAKKQIDDHRAAGREVMPCSSIRFYGQYRFAVSTFGTNSRPGLMHLENVLWRNEWLATSLPVQPHRLPDRHAAPGQWFGKKEQPRGLASYCPASDYQDLYLWRLDKLIRDTGLGAIYLDQPMTECSNPLHGCGYIDYQGRWRAIVPIFAQRRMMKRLHRLFYDTHGKTMIKWHCSNQLVPPIVSFIDVFWDGENYGSGPHKVFEFYSKALPPGRLQAEHTGLPFGFAADLLPEFEERYAPSPASPRDMMGTMIVHDGTVFPAHTPHPALVTFLQEARLSQPLDRMQTVYYWDRNAHRTIAPATVLSIMHVGEGRALLVLFNPADTPVAATVSLDVAALGLPANLAVRDLATQSPLPAALPLTVPLAAHDVRLLLWEAP